MEKFICFVQKKNKKIIKTPLILLGMFFLMTQPLNGSFKFLTNGKLEKLISIVALGGSTLLIYEGFKELWCWYREKKELPEVILLPNGAYFDNLEIFPHEKKVQMRVGENKFNFLYEQINKRADYYDAYDDSQEAWVEVPYCDYLIDLKLKAWDLTLAIRNELRHNGNGNDRKPYVRPYWNFARKTWFQPINHNYFRKGLWRTGFGIAGLLAVLGDYLIKK